MTHVPVLRAALQEAAERRYGRRRRARRWASFALAPALAAAALAIVLASPAPAPEETAKPNASTHTVRITPLPPRPHARFRIVQATVMARAQAEAAYAGAAHTSADEGTLLRAWSVPGVDGAAVFLTRRNNGLCVSTREPPAGDFPGQWAAGCNGKGPFRRSGTSLVVGDTYVAVTGTKSVTPTYRLPNGMKRTLRVGDGGLVMIQGAPEGAQVAISDYVTKIELPRDVRYQCSDGTALTVRVDRGSPKQDPCADGGG
jgi:hypothetical protein